MKICLSLILLSLPNFSCELLETVKTNLRNKRDQEHEQEQHQEYFFDDMDVDATFSPKQFKSDHILNEDAFISLYFVSENNSISYDGKDYSLDDLEPLDVFTKKATYMHNGIKSKTPAYKNLFKKTVTSGEDETVLIVKKDEHLDINVILIATKNGDGENDVAELVNISPGVFSNIISSDYNLDQLGEKFLLQEKLVDQSSFENYTNISQEESFISDTNGSDNNGCTSFRTIELAVAYESSFCASNQNDASNSDTSVMYIIAGISQKYQQESLCVKVELSHLEGYCDSGTDPYKQMVAINSSGCSSYGLLDMFQDFWETERKEVHRDTAHLFSGTGLECTNGRCVVGCAYVGSMCTSYAYGVNYVTFSMDFNLRNVLVAHELGHNCGASHYYTRDYIMYPSVNPGNKGFSQNSIQSFLNHFQNVGSCVQVEKNPTNGPSLLPSANPSSSPSTVSPTIYPSLKPSQTPTLLSSTNPSASPSNVPSQHLSRNPSSTPSDLSSESPSLMGSSSPSLMPSNVSSDLPSLEPSNSLSSAPSYSPSLMPSSLLLSTNPSSSPSTVSSRNPSISPTIYHSLKPSQKPTFLSSTNPSASSSTVSPTFYPSLKPSQTPTLLSSTNPSASPSIVPSSTPSNLSSESPSSMESSSPSLMPSNVSSDLPSLEPSYSLSSSPSYLPSLTPSSLLLSTNPSSSPSSIPSKNPSSSPTWIPSIDPTNNPSSSLSIMPSSMSDFPSSSMNPSMSPSLIPIENQSNNPSHNPSPSPSAVSSMNPSTILSPNSNKPSSTPSQQSSTMPSVNSSINPSFSQSLGPSFNPSFSPSIKFSSVPSTTHSHQPSAHPSSAPTKSPTEENDDNIIVLILKRIFGRFFP